MGPKSRWVVIWFDPNERSALMSQPELRAENWDDEDAAANVARVYQLRGLCAWAVELQGSGQDAY